MSPLRKSALKQYRISPMVSWILGITFALLSAGLILLDVFLGFLSILFVVFIILPMFFSMLFLHAGLTYNRPVTVRDFFRYYAMFFKSPFRGTYSVLSILWKATLVFFGVSLVSGIIGTGVCRMINLADYNTMMDTLLEFIMGESTSGLVTIEEIFGSTYYLFVIYMAISMVPAVISAVAFFIYFALRNALSMHLRSNMVRAPSMACSQIFNITWRRKKELRMDYLRLQWPIILIITVLPILTSTLTFIFLRDYSIMSTFGVASILLGVGLYFPFYSANNEALWIKYENEFKQSVYLFAENSVHNIQRRMEMADQEKEELEKALNDLKEHINQQTSQNEEKTDEDNPSDDNNDQQV